MTEAATVRPGTETDQEPRSGGRRSSGRGRPRPAFPVVAVLPFAAVLAVFAIYPLAELLRMSVSDTRISSGQFISHFTGLDNYLLALADPVAMTSIVNTVVFVATTVPLTLALGTALAILLDRAALVKRIGQTVILWPAVIAPVVVSVIWLLILSPTIGLLNDVLETLGLPTQGWLGSGVGAMAAIIAVDVWHWTPLVFLLVYTSLRGLDSDVLEAARVDGASEWRLLRNIVLPLLKPTLVAAGLIRLVMGVKAFDEMYLLTHGGPGTATTLITHHIRNVFFDALEFGEGAAFSVIVVFAVGLGITVVAAIRNRRSEIHP